jgi:hypothetical protein
VTLQDNTDPDTKILVLPVHLIERMNCYAFDYGQAGWEHKLLALLQSTPVERDRFVPHLYQSRREYRRTCETAGKSGKQIERCVFASFQVAESMGFKGEFRQWEHLLRIGEITGGYRDPISDVPADPAARDRVSYGRESFVCEKARPLFRPLAEK